MEAIRLLQREGYELSLDGENIRCLKKRGRAPNPEKVRTLLREIKLNKSEAVNFLKKICLHDEKSQGVINNLNRHCIHLMIDMPESTRKGSLRLEEEITLALNSGRTETFRSLLEQWKRCLH
jgi:hypothetical protein